MKENCDKYVVPGTNRTSFRTDWIFLDKLDYSIARGYVSWFLATHGRSSFDDIYKNSNLGDIDLYVAIHCMIVDNLVIGDSPYSDKPQTHKELIYELK